jgi:hypothetical protein
MGQPINASKGVIGMDSDWIRMDSNLDITIYHILIQIHIKYIFYRMYSNMNHIKSEYDDFIVDKNMILVVSKL